MRLLVLAANRSSNVMQKKRNHKYRRMVTRLPDEMKELLDCLDHEYFVVAHSKVSPGVFGDGMAVDEFELRWVRSDEEQFALLIERKDLVARRDHAPVFAERCGDPGFFAGLQIDAGKALVP